MTNVRYFLFLSIFAFFFCFPNQVLAGDVFLFHFKQNKNDPASLQDFTLTVEEKNDPLFSMLSFLNEAPSSGEYQISLYDTTDSLIGNFFFDFSLKDKEFSLIIPYFSIAKKYEVYTTKDLSLLLEGNLTRFISCNNNGICEPNKNETAFSCVPDCGSEAILYEEILPPPITNTDASPSLNTKKSNLTFFILVLISALFISSLVLYFILIKKKSVRTKKFFFILLLGIVIALGTFYTTLSLLHIEIKL